ncbi:MAG: sigma-70 family RNA polymerase sigma factor [Prosthecobacter sp.]|uniref:RNA polymerase sigma factor n=1 Tax=Prosthecobacter sp. TaxID=1965333 RepID=UPI003BAE241F
MTTTPEVLGLVPMPDAPLDADIEAMQRLAAGDDEALKEIMQRWSDKVAAFLLRMTGEPATAGDLAEETFVKLFQNCGTYSPSATFSTYLFTIASNLARNHERWRQRHPTVELEEEVYDAHAVSAESHPDTQMENSERQGEIEAALAALPTSLREAMLLLTYENMSYAEIASATGCNVKTVEMRIYRARQLLKDWLKDDHT